MPLNKLDNFIKNTEGRILYVSPADLDSTDSILNTGNSLARPFKTIQRALIEAARFSYVKGNANDAIEKTTILLMPGVHEIDNRPGYQIFNDSGAKVTAADGSVSNAAAADHLPLTLDSNFDITQEGNDLIKFNSIYGGVIVPRGTSIVGLDLRKTKIKPKYVPNPTDDDVDYSAIFRITGTCYFWQFCVFDGDEFGLVYTQSDDFTIQSVPNFSHHKLTVFEYADGVNKVGSTELTDLEMYYAKLSIAYGTGTDRDIDDKFPAKPKGFEPQRPEYEIVGAFASDPLKITSIEAGSGGTPTNRVTVTTALDHNLTTGTPIRISGVSPTNYNISTKVAEVDATNTKVFYYNLESFPVTLQTPGTISGDELVTVETDTVTGASPYIFNISMRSVWGMQGMHADGSKATGFRSMVVAQFTGVSLQKDDRAFVQYIPSTRTYSSTLSTSKVTGADLSAGSSSSGRVYHLESDSIYRSGWESSHIKISNDAILQIVSVFAIGYNKHFDIQSGGDASITNSNSNFGQLALIADGFKAEAFAKDNKAFLTHVIPPKAITASEENVDWVTIDRGKTTTVGITSHLYLFGFEDEEVKPVVLTQGYRIGARKEDKLYLSIGSTTYSADILMEDGSSSFKTYSVDAPSSNVFTISSGTHDIQTAEKVIVLSDDGDMPENIKVNKVYYAIRESSTELKLASSESDANNDDAITVYGGTNLTITTRVSDKESGDVGSPVQWDSTNNHWYINTNTGSDIFSNLSGTGASEATFVKRIADTRSLDEKIYKYRVVIPKQLSNSKTPESAFIIQESSTTGFGTDADFTKTSIDSTDYDFSRNPRFISTCSFSSDVVTVITEQPHNLTLGDDVNIRNVTDSTLSSTGDFNKGYNGKFTVTEITDDLTFKYALSTRTPGTFTNDTTQRTTSLPRFDRIDLKANLNIYRNEVVSEYDDGEQNGIYHLYVLKADSAVPVEFTDLKYSQNVVDLYPQLDRDNINDNPNSAKSFALRSPLGDVTTNDLKKSVTREASDTLLTKFGVGLDISSVNNATPGITTITFDRRHGLDGIVDVSVTNAGSGFANGNHFNVKLLNNGTSTWDGATANINVSGGAVGVATIVSPGSGYAAGEVLDIDGFSGAEVTVSTGGITTSIGQVVQFTGAGTTSDTYYRINSVPAANQISIAKTAGDTLITADQYALVVSPSQAFTATSSGGISTFTSGEPHGLTVGNKFRVLDTENNNLGDFIVATKVGISTFTISSGISTTSGFILKHGLSSNSGDSNVGNENLEARAITIFDGDILTLSEAVTTTDTAFSVSHVGLGTATRFPLGSYIQIDNEIMRVASSTLSGLNSDELTVIRGALGSRQTAHVNGSLIKKIKVPSIEFRRPSIVRASGHTFEYLGFGPGNYSTGLPQLQDRAPTETEEFLTQAQERAGGTVVYTGMNNKGDFFVGNQKKSSATGEEITFDTPIPTVTGQDPATLSVVFDEVIIKNNLVVEGGASNQLLSQFDGPVTFNNNTRFNDQVRITDETDSSSTKTGALIVTGGVGVGKTITAANITAGDVTINGSTSTINSTSGDLKIDAPVGNKVAIGTHTEVDGDFEATGKITADELDVPNISPIGSIMLWPGGTDSWPTATWRQCNGAALSRTTYANLFTILGTTYGSGDGSTTFNLPNLQNRFPVGAGDDYSQGGTGGSKDAIVVSHTHTASTATAGAHSHSIGGNVGFGGNNVQFGSGYAANGGNTSTHAGHNHSVTVNSQGSSGTDANLPPYMGLYYIIRIR